MRVIDAITKLFDTVSSGIAMKYYGRLLNQAFTGRVAIAPVSGARKKVGRRS
jgi:hypothetical protein